MNRLTEPERPATERLIPAGPRSCRAAALSAAIAIKASPDARTISRQHAALRAEWGGLGMFWCAWELTDPPIVGTPVTNEALPDRMRRALATFITAGRRDDVSTAYNTWLTVARWPRGTTLFLHEIAASLHNRRAYR